MLSFDSRIYSAHYDFPLPLSSSLVPVDFMIYIVILWSLAQMLLLWWRRLLLYENKLPRALAGQRCVLDLSCVLLLHSDIFHDRMQVVNVAESCLLKLRDVHLYFSAPIEMCSSQSAPTECPFGTGYAVSILSAAANITHLHQKTGSDDGIHSIFLYSAVDQRQKPCRGARQGSVVVLWNNRMQSLDYCNGNIWFTELGNVCYRLCLIIKKLPFGINAMSFVTSAQCYYPTKQPSVWATCFSVGRANSRAAHLPAQVFKEPKWETCNQMIKVAVCCVSACKKHPILYCCILVS